MTPFGGYYRGRRVLVTGQTGFKGSWLAAWLLELGADVSGMSLRLATEPSPLGEPPAERHLSAIAGDVSRPDDVVAAFDAHQPEVVIHLAAQPLVRRAYSEPLTTFETNVMGTVNVLDAAVRSPSTRAVVAVTTDKVYANHEWEWGYREIDELGGHDPYSASKAAAEMAVRAYSAPGLQKLHRPAGASRHRFGEGREHRGRRRLGTGPPGTRRDQGNRGRTRCRAS